MNSHSHTGQPGDHALRTNPQLQWVDRVTTLLDSQFSLPGTNFRFGIDPIIGLIPGAGSVVSFTVSAALIVTMARHGVSGAVVVRMLLNVLLDMIVGSIPLIGTLFDFGYKANRRNVNLLRKHYQEGKYRGSGLGIILLVLAVGLLLMIGILIVTWKLIERIIETVQSF